MLTLSLIYSTMPRCTVRRSTGLSLTVAVLVGIATSDFASSANAPIPNERAHKMLVALPFPIRQTVTRYGDDGRVNAESVAILNPAGAVAMFTVALSDQLSLPAQSRAESISIFKEGNYFDAVKLENSLALSPSTAQPKWLIDTFTYAFIESLAKPLESLRTLAVSKEVLSSNPDVSASLLDRYSKLNIKESLDSGTFKFSIGAVEYLGEVDPSGFISKVDAWLDGRIRTSVRSEIEKNPVIPSYAEYITVAVGEEKISLPKTRSLPAPANPTFGLGLVPASNGSWLVAGIVRSSPAEKAGIEPGSRITRFAGVDLSKLDASAVKELIAKVPDSIEIDLIEPDGEKRTQRLVRALAE